MNRGPGGEAELVSCAGDTFQPIEDMSHFIEDGVPAGRPA